MRLGEGIVTRGMGHGFTNGLGAGWSEQLVAHASQLHRIPETLDDRTAVLSEPLSISIHGILRRPPDDGAPALVVGAGIIGLTAVAALRYLCPSSEITIVAKHDHQRRAAMLLGASHVVRPDDEEPFAVLSELAALSGAPLTGRGEGAMLAGGYPVVVEAVGSAASVDVALRAAEQRGTVHLIGVIGRAPVDLAPLWFKELDVVGSFCHAVDKRGPGDDGHHSFDRALDLLAAGGLPADTVITHEAPLDDVRAAIGVALARDRGAIKVVLRPV
jgi:threonine dehydrogenase-like Zn-dependent dehydrogenase